MVFKTPHKRQRDPSVTGSSGSWKTSPTSRSVTSSSSAAQSYSSKHFIERPRKIVKADLSQATVYPTSPQRPAVIEDRGHGNSTVLSDPNFQAEDDITIHEREESDALNEVVMALELRGKDNVGCSFYVAKEETLYIMGDVMFGGLETVEILKIHIDPTVVLLSSRVDDKVYESMDPNRQRGASMQPEENQFRNPYVLETRPSPEFGFESGKKKLTDINTIREDFQFMDFVTPGLKGSIEGDGANYEAGYTTDQGKALRLSAWIDLGSQLSIGCAGAILTYLQRRRSVQYLPGDDGASTFFRVSAVEMFTLKDTMLINADTLASLQIMQSESHPHSHNQGPTSSGSKEGLSIYGLFHHLAKTPQGKFLLRQYFLRPTLDLELILERHRAISVFLRPDNEAYMTDLIKSLKQIKNMKTIMIHLHKGMNSTLTNGGGIKNGAWSSLRSFLYYTMGIRKVFTEITGADGLEIRAKVLEKFETHQLAHLGRKITKMVDFRTSAEMHRTVVLPGVDDELDELKRKYDGLEDLLNTTSKNIASSIPRHFSLDLNVIFFPQIGFLISMPMGNVTGRAEYEGGDDGHPQWDRIFSTSSRVYCRDYRMEELNCHFGDMYAVICNREIELIHELATEVLTFEVMLCTVSSICGELDCLLALAQGARLYKLTRPQMTTENVIDIEGGRHILQELVVSTYVANDTHLLGGSPPKPMDATSEASVKPPAKLAAHALANDTVKYPSMLILTGANYSGKSIYLKQVALIVYMAHVGSFVPVDRSIIGLTDKILTRIVTRETVSRIHSAFMSDLQQISSAINQATNRSLLIIDEFGKGTDAADGAGLACGVFEYLKNLGDARPKVLAATHFHEIFENGFLAQCSELQYAHMEVRVDEQTTNLEEQITYLYNLRPKRSVSSYGTVCAALNGIAQNIVDRAEELIEKVAQGEDIVTVCALGKSDDDKELQAAEELSRLLLLEDLDTAESAKIFVDGLEVE